MISILSAGCAFATLHPRFRHPSLRPYRAAMYSCLGLSAVVFIVHGIILDGWEMQNRRMSLDRMGLMALLNFAGAYAYAARIPEKWYPRKYDIVGASHQILHFMVIFAGLAHMDGMVRAFQFSHSKGGCL